VTDWRALAAGKQARYETPHGAPDERSLVRRGNTAYAAGLALLMVPSAEATTWFRRAAESWRRSWELAGAGAWGRPVGVLKAALLAGDEPATLAYADWAIRLDGAQQASPIGRYAAALALLARSRFEHARRVAAPLRGAEDFPNDVAEALEGLAVGDAGRVQEAVASVVASFEGRTAYLEDVAVADTALVLHVLAKRRGLALELPASSVLPATPLRPARSPDETRP
jgi:hypothetical protein